jgi:hypothetical protein
MSSAISYKYIVFVYQLPGKELLHDFYDFIVNINRPVPFNRKLDSTNYNSPQSTDCLQYRGDHLYLLLISIPIEFFYLLSG